MLANLWTSSQVLLVPVRKKYKKSPAPPVHPPWPPNLFELDPFDLRPSKRKKQDLKGCGLLQGLGEGRGGGGRMQ